MSEGVVGNASNVGGRTQESMAEVAATLVPVEGWHFLHLMYRVDRATFASLSLESRTRGREQLRAALSQESAEGVEQLQCYAILGHKADFGVMMAGPDPRALHAVQMALQSSTLGPALVPTYSFTSLSEVSEYVPDTDTYAKLLREREHMDPESAVYKTRLAQYGARLEGMNKHRLYPQFPQWPYVCFYPMNKIRVAPDQNWYTTPFGDRMEMMADHGKSGMKFGGKVSQVITASTGLDDWEWGVTLWARNPSYIKEIVYTMRFDRASAQFAQFGPFYPGYILPPEQLLDDIRV
jgi:chlorite dismutase